MKKERYLNQLVDVIRVLRGSEIELAKKHLKAYGTNHTINSQKMFQLYQLIKQKKIKDFDKLKKKVSPNSSESSFNKLIIRTSDRIQESLIVDVNIKRKGAYSDLFRMKFFVKKQIIQGQILMGRGLKDRPLVLFNNAIRNTKKYELYDELLEALYYKQILLVRFLGEKGLHFIENEIKYYDRCRSVYRNARYLHQVYNTDTFKTSDTKRISKEFEEKVNLLREDFNETGSANVLSYYFLLKIDIERSRKNENKVIALLREFITLLKSSTAVFSSGRIGILHNELAKTQLTCLNFEEACKESIESIQWIKKESTSFLVYNNTYAQILIFQDKLKEADNCIQKLRERKAIKKFPIHESIALYQKAIINFKSGEYKEALKIFSQKNEIEKDKEGWNVWIRIMRLLCAIELESLELIDYDIENFRKYMERIGKQYTVRERDKLILKVLQELDRQNYDFKAVLKEREEELRQLKSTDPKYTWTSDSPEFILFHDWFMAKAEGRVYKANFDRYRKEI